MTKELFQEALKVLVSLGYCVAKTDLLSPRDVPKSMRVIGKTKAVKLKKVVKDFEKSYKC